MFQIFRSVLALILLTALVAAEDPATKLVKPIRIPANAGIGTNISEDGQVATIIFDNAFVELNPVTAGSRGAHNQTATESKVITVNVPFTTKQRSAAMTLDMRGFCDVDPGVNARLIICAGDKTHVADLSADEDVKLQKGIKENYDAEEGSQDFFDRMNFTVQVHAEKPVCQLTIILEVDRDTDKADTGSALLVLDTLDLSVAPPAKAAR